ncbi:MAG: FecCD family ABC transporter permease [Candidatus Entotheonellia bacterium]
MLPSPANAVQPRTAAKRIGFGEGIGFGGLVLLTLATIVVCLGIGRVALEPERVLAVLLSGVGIGGSVDPLERAIVLNVRLPRTLLAALSGAGLAVAGAALQGCLRNPLVGPQNVGVLSGAGFGGSIGLFLAWGPFGIAGAAFVGGLAAMLLVLWLGRSAGQTTILMLVLAGVVVSALFAALTTLLQYLADPERQLPALVFWLMGSFATADMSKLALAVGPVLLGVLVLAALAFRLNILASGEDEARALGVPVGRDRTLVLCAVAAICAAVVAVAGLIAWVGLVMPHLARMLFGPDHRRLLPASALLGAAFLTVVDTLCRSATAAEIPVGAITALVGAPVFIYLLKRTHARGWRPD